MYFSLFGKLQILVKFFNFFIITLRADLKHIGLFLVTILKTNLQLEIFQSIVSTKLPTFLHAKRKLILMQDKLSDPSLETKKGKL